MKNYTRQQSIQASSEAKKKYNDILSIKNVKKGAVSDNMKEVREQVSRLTDMNQVLRLEPAFVRGIIAVFNHYDFDQGGTLDVEELRQFFDTLR